MLSAAIVVTLAAGLGVDVGVFAVIDGAMFQPRVTHQPDRFVQVTSRSTFADGSTATSTSLDDWRAYRSETRAFADIAAWTPVHATIARSASDPSAVSIVPVLVTCNFFPVFGPEAPIAGRLFRADECDGSRPAAVVVIGENVWRTRFGASTDVVGSTIALDRRPFTVVGIMPRGYAGHLRTDIWVPYAMASAFFAGRDLQREAATPWLMALAGRLRPGVSWEQARSELSATAARQDRNVPGRTTILRLSNGSLMDSDVLRPMTFWIVPLVMGALSLVLLLVCANVTTLLLSRGVARRQEMAIRLSLGAKRSRLLVMLLTESVMLAAVSAPLAAAVAYAVPVVIRYQVPTMPAYPFRVDKVVLAYLCGTALVAGIAAGLAPALESLKQNVAASLHGYDAPVDGGRRWHVRDFLIAGQVSLSMVLLVGAALFVRAESRVRARDRGFDAEQVLLVAPRIRVPPYSRDGASTFYRTLADRVRAIPAVRGVAFTSAPPLGAGDFEEGNLSLTIATSGGRQIALTSMNAVTPNYFAVLGIPIVRGRIFDQSGERSGYQPAVLSADAARALVGADDPIGQLLHDKSGRAWTVVGVARNVVGTIAKGGPDLTIYVPRPRDAAGDAVVIRFDGDSRTVAEAIRNVMATMDPNAVAEPRTLAALRDDVSERLLRLVQMLLALAAAALILALIGIYGVVAFAVRVRTRELGIHMALGATRPAIVRLVLVSGMKPVAYGAAAGIALSLLASSALTEVFRNTPAPLNPREPAVYLVVAVALISAAAGAIVWPACRAAWSEPARVLRQD